MSSLSLANKGLGFWPVKSAVKKEKIQISKIKNFSKKDKKECFLWFCFELEFFDIELCFPAQFYGYV